MSQNYLIGAKCTHLDEPGLYKDYKLLMTWSQFVANNYTNNEVTRLVLPSTFIGSGDNVIHCSSLTELSTEDKTLLQCDTNFLADIPNALKTTEGGATYININNNPYYAVSNIGSATSIEDGCVVFPGLVTSTITGTLNALYIPDSVEYIGTGNNFSYKCRSLEIEGNDNLNIRSTLGAGSIGGTNSIIESIVVNKAASIAGLDLDPSYVDPAHIASTALPIHTVYLNASEIGPGVLDLRFEGNKNYYLPYLSSVELGPDVTAVEVDWSNYSLTQTTGYSPTHINYAGTGSQWSSALDYQSSIRNTKVYCTDGYWQYNSSGTGVWHSN